MSVALTTMALLAVAVASATSPRPAPDLSPAAWLAGLRRYAYDNNSYFGEHATVTPAGAPKVGLVSVTSNFAASVAGFQALAAGGNAADACIAAATSGTVLALNSYVSFGGIADIVYFDRASNTTTSIVGNWGRVAGNPDPQVEPLGRSVFVGGFPHAIAELSDRFGVLSLAALLEPARYFAANGSPKTAVMPHLDMSALNHSAYGRGIREQILNESATAVKQPALAALLERIQNFTAGGWRNASHALRQLMYNASVPGSFAAEAVVLVNAHGGNITAADFARYRAISGKASEIEVPQNGLRTLGATDAAASSLGFVELTEELHIVEALGWVLEAERPAYNATVFATLAQVDRWTATLTDFLAAPAAARATLADLAPSVFTAADVASVEAFQSRRMQRSYGAAVAKLLGNMTSFNELLASFFGLAQPREFSLRGGSHSDALVAVDAAGNVCSMAHSINTATMWGTGLFAAGVPLSSAAAGAQNRALNRATPTTQNVLMTPTRPNIAVETTSGQPVVAYSSIGESLGQATLQSLVALYAEFASSNASTHQSVVDACNAPHFHFDGAPLEAPLRVNPVSVNVGEACDVQPQAWQRRLCAQFNAQTSSMPREFIASLPDWLTLFNLDAYTGEARFGHNGIMAAARLTRSADGIASVTGCASPAANGGPIGF